MLSALANILSSIGSTVASTSTTATFWWVYDEPEMPESLQD